MEDGDAIAWTAAVLATLGALFVWGAVTFFPFPGERETFQAGNFIVSPPVLADPERLNSDEAARLRPSDTLVEVRVTAPTWEGDVARADIAGCDNVSGWEWLDEPERFHDLFVCPGAEEGTRLTVELHVWDWDEPVLFRARLIEAADPRA